MQEHKPPEFVDFKCTICKEYRGFNWSDQHICNVCGTDY